MQRENSETAPSERGTYLFTFKFISEPRHYKGYFESEDREQWKTRLPELLKEMAKERAEQETQLRAMGIRIDENYHDPEISTLKNTP